MVAQLLRLKLRLFANGFRRPLWIVIVSGLGLAIAIATVLVIANSAAAMHDFDDRTVRRMVIIVGSYLSLAAFLLPFMIVRRELLDPRALRGHRFKSWAIAVTILVLSVVGPMLLIAPIAWAPTWAWRDAESVRIAQIAAPILFLQAVLSVRLGVAGGAALANRERWSRRVRVIGTIILVAGLPAVIAAVIPRFLAIPDGQSRLFVVGLFKASAYLQAEKVADALSWTPVGALWAAPSHATFEDPQLGPQALWVGGICTFVLLVFWFIAVRIAFRATRRIPVEHRGGAPGWFRRLPSTPAGAVAARSFTYWVRDPRYRAVLGFLPFVPIVILGVSFIGGIPLSLASLLPLPLMVILFALATSHNDVAYDSTAVWVHVAAQTNGINDRVGRIVPIIAGGLVLIAVGTPLTALGYGSFEVVPAVVGASLALLLGGVGVASGLSARFPYAAPRPGDPAFQQPQVQGSTGSGAQTLAVLCTMLVAAPAIMLGVMWLMQTGSALNWIALLVGIQAGLIALFIGIRVGGIAFDKGSPELLAFTMRH